MTGLLKAFGAAVALAAVLGAAGMGVDASARAAVIIAAVGWAVLWIRSDGRAESQAEEREEREESLGEPPVDEPQVIRRRGGYGPEEGGE